MSRALPSLPTRLARAALVLAPAPVREAWREITGESHVAAIRTNYAAAQQNRLMRDWVANCLPPDDEYRGELRTIRARSRELVRNNAYADNGARLLKVNVVGPKGFRLQVAADERSNRAIEKAWRRYMRRPVTVDRRLRGIPVQELIVELLYKDGEVFLRHFPTHRSNPFRHAVQFVDPDLVDETFNRDRSRGVNEVRMGVEIDDDGAPVAYHVGRFSARRLSLAFTERERVPAEEMDHLYVTRRPNQTRGLPWVLSAALAMRLTDKYEETEAITSRAGSAKMGILVPGPDAPDEIVEPVDEATGAPKRVDIAKTFSANPGGVFVAPRGYGWQDWNPEHPSTAFLPFRKGMLQKVASGLGPSYVSLANDLEGVSFSSIRQGTMSERDFFMCVQTFVGEGELLGWYERWLPVATLAGQVEIPLGDLTPFLDATMQGRGWQYVNPVQDVVADKEAIAGGLWSRTRSLAERGYDPDEIFEELRREQALAEQLGIDVSIAIDKATAASALDSSNGSGGSRATERRQLKGLWARLGHVLSGGDDE